jgi:hypothetical protein
VCAVLVMTVTVGMLDWGNEALKSQSSSIMRYSEATSASTLASFIINDAFNTAVPPGDARASAVPGLWAPNRVFETAHDGADDGARSDCDSCEPPAALETEADAVQRCSEGGNGASACVVDPTA